MPQVAFCPRISNSYKLCGTMCVLMPCLWVRGWTTLHQGNTGHLTGQCDVCKSAGTFYQPLTDILFYSGEPSLQAKLTSATKSISLKFCAQLSVPRRLPKELHFLITRQDKSPIKGQTKSAAMDGLASLWRHCLLPTQACSSQSDVRFARALKCSWLNSLSAQS